VKLSTIFLWSGLALVTGAALALPAGEYLMSKGEGTLDIKADQNFVIDTIGTNSHTCNFTGKISKQPSRIEDSACYLSFTLKGADVLVSTENRYTTKEEAGCSSFCGMRAAFDGGMFYSLPQCNPNSVAKMRKKFKMQFDRKEYATAKQNLEKLLSQCDHVLHWSQLDWIRNDLALTQYKTGDTAACLQTLRPLHIYAETSDDELPKSTQPIDVELIIPIAKATRTNLKLCGASTR
jgi:hypothetical protein